MQIIPLQVVIFAVFDQPPDVYLFVSHFGRHHEDDLLPAAWRLAIRILRAIQKVGDARERADR